MQVTEFKATIVAIAPARLRGHIFSARRIVPAAAPALIARNAPGLLVAVRMNGFASCAPACSAVIVECASSAWVRAVATYRAGSTAGRVIDENSCVRRAVSAFSDAGVNASFSGET